MSDKALEAGHAAPVVSISNLNNNKDEYEKQTGFAPPLHAQTTSSTLDPYYHSAPLPPLPPATRTPVLTRLRTRWTFLSTRTRYIIYGTAAFLVVLIIALGAGLGATAHSRSPSANLTPGVSHTGDLTWYQPALGACGLTNTDADDIVAVAHSVFDAASTSSNPNLNPLCGRRIRISGSNGKKLDVTVVDRCVGCKPDDLDGTLAVFKKFADPDQGRIVTSWAWLS